VIDGGGPGGGLDESRAAGVPDCAGDDYRARGEEGGDHEASDGNGTAFRSETCRIGLQVLFERRQRMATQSWATRDLVNELSAMRTWVSGFGRERFEPDRAGRMMIWLWL
jgi:hypothetical protein